VVCSCVRALHADLIKLIQTRLCSMQCHPTKISYQESMVGDQDQFHIQDSEGPSIRICSTSRFASSASFVVCRSRQINPGQQYPVSDLTTESEESRRFSLNSESLMTLLAVLAIPGSRALQPVVLIVLIHVISLRLAVSACFLQISPCCAHPQCILHG